MSDVSALNLESGEVVGGYTLISRLGSGAMGSVWRVRDDGGQTYAMKILRDSLSEDSYEEDSEGPLGGAESDGRSDARNGDAPARRSRAHPARDPNLKENVTPRERLRREALSLRKVNHPGVCGIVDMELDDAVAFIVTDLIEGRNLRDDVAVNGRYVGNDLERLARKLMDAVRAVHRAGIVHRDIKPTNVMVSATGPVLVDFGIAMGEGESHVTRTGLVMGTPGFIAPEIIDGAESDEATDWWSVASVLAFAATGRPVFGTKPLMVVLEREAAGNANLTGLPPHTMAAFRSALHPDPSRRCTPEQLLHAIALDAVNPLFADASGAGVMPPFDAAEGRDVEPSAEPRIWWRSAFADDAAERAASEAALRALPPAACAAALPSDALCADDVRPAVPSALDFLLDDDDTASDGAYGLTSDGAQGVPVVDAVRDEESDHPSMLESPIRPALQRVADNANLAIPAPPLPPMPPTSRGTRGTGSADAPDADGSAAPPDAEATVVIDEATAMPPDVPTTPDASGVPDAEATAVLGEPTKAMPEASEQPTAVLAEKTATLPERTTALPEETKALPEATSPLPDQAPRASRTARTARSTAQPQRPQDREPRSLSGTARAAQPTFAEVTPERTTVIGTVPDFLREAQDRTSVLPNRRTRPGPPAYPPPPDDAVPVTYSAPPVGLPSDWRTVVTNAEPMSPSDRSEREDRYQGYDRADDYDQPSRRLPAGERRARYYRGGAAPLAWMTVVPAVAALFDPSFALLAALLLFWVTLTVGYSAQAQLDREERRGGVRRGSDAALRVVQLPWHTAKGFGFAALRAALFALVDAAASWAAMAALNLPWGYMRVDVWPYTLPWPAGDPLSRTSFAMAGMAAVAWLVTAFWPRAHVLRLGAGAMRGAGAEDADE